MSRPVHEIRLGLIKASVWQRRSRSGHQFSVSVVRLYRNGDEWKQSSRFGRDDLPVVRLVLDQAHSWLFQRVQETKRSHDGRL